MIRRATEDDVMEVSELVLQHAKEHGWEDQSGILVDKFSVRSVLRMHAYKPDMCLFVSENGKIDGLLAGIMVPWPLDVRTQAAHEELAVGNNKEEMREEFYKWAKEQGSPVVVQSCLEGEGRMRRI